MIFRSIAVLIVAAAAWIGGCAVSDAPPNSLGESSVLYGVRVLSSSPPYRIESVSSLPAGENTATVWNEQSLQRRSHRLVSGHYADWEWTVWATPEVSAAWQRGNEHTDAAACTVGGPHCHRLDWNRALTNLYRTAAYLLGKRPLPLNLRLNLVAEGQGIRAQVLRQSQLRVPLAFTFGFPTDTKARPDRQLAREQALVEAVGLVGYEFQHVEYAAGDTATPTLRQPGPQYLKNEANSACWRLASRIVILAGQPGQVTIDRVTRGDLASYASRFGNTVRLQTAAVWGPVLLRHDLGDYLAHSLRPSGDKSALQIHTTDYPQMNRVLAYCRGFTRYQGDIAKRPMPVSAVADQLFWK